MIKHGIVNQLNGLKKLGSRDRIAKENELFDVINDELMDPLLQPSSWDTLCELVTRFSKPFQITLTKMLIARAPRELVVQNLLDTLDPIMQKESSALRNIWLNIDRLNEERHDGMTRSSAKEKWHNVSGLFFDVNKAGRKVIGRALRADYWREGYNLGQYAKVGERWHKIWEKSNTDLNFVTWCQAIGLESSQSTAYFNEIERQHLLVTFIGGKFFNSKNNFIDTTEEVGFQEPGMVDFVMAMDESVYCYGESTKIFKEGDEHHSGILSGKPVLFAGEMCVKNGVITKITTRSGHYEPTEQQLVNFLHVLEKNAIDLTNVIIKDAYYQLLSSDAKTYLAESPLAVTSPKHTIKA